MGDQKAIIDRIKKLRALAAKNPSASEAETAARIAAKLCAEHMIAEAALAADVGEDGAMIVDDDGLPGTRRFERWRSYLLEILCELSACSHAYFKTKSGYEPHIFGRQDDVDLVRETYTWLSLAVEQATAKACKGKSEHYRLGYREGIVYGIKQAVDEAKGEAEKTAPSSALAVLDERAKAADVALQQFLKGAKKAPKGPKELDPEAYERGEKKGRKLHARIPSKRKADLQQ